MDRLRGRVILITGSTGIAAATAVRCGTEGASVFIVSRTADHAEGLAARVAETASPGAGSGWFAADLTSERETDAAVSAALERFGRIDGFFSVAGGSGRRFGDGRIHTVTAEAWEATADLNLRTQILACARVVRAMRDQAPNDGGTRGSVLLLGSVTTVAPVPELFGTHAYAAAKGALTALMTTMAATYAADRIRVNLVAPSLTATPMATRAATDPHILEYARRKQPLAGEMLDPDEVAKAAIYFLSDESRTVTGQSLAVDGGWSVISTTAGSAGMIRDVPVMADVDVCVVGAGSAGSSAAIAAARAGASVLLIDRLPFLGGTSTAVLDTFYGFYTPGSESRKVVGGIGDDVVAALRELGPVLQRPNTYGAGTGITYLADHLKVAWEQLATEAGVRILLHAMLQAVDVRDGRVESILVATRAGLARVRATTFIDASGDADLCAFAGFGFETAGDVDPAQTLTTTFRMVNVDLERRRTVSKTRFHELMADAAATGGYDLPRREGSDHETPVDGMTATVMTRLDSFRRDDGGRIVNATDPWFLTQAEIAGRRQALEYVGFLVDRVPGYEHASLVALGTGIGVRETRRVYGDYRLTRDDVLSGRTFDDAIGLCGAPIEDHHGADGDGTTWHYLPDGATVDIPYRSLIVRDAANVLVAGRCFSATHDAHASVRSMAQCMAMGQAAGTAAALATSIGTDPRDVPIEALRDHLRADGAILELPTAQETTAR